MLLGLIINTAIGIICIVIGLLLWKKSKINLIHSYHYTKVKKEDVKAYTTRIGIAMLLIGSGCLITGAVNYFTDSAYGYIVFALCFIAAMILFARTQKKYNSGIF